MHNLEEQFFLKKKIKRNFPLEQANWINLKNNNKKTLNGDYWYSFSSKFVKKAGEMHWRSIAALWVRSANAAASSQYFVADLLLFIIILH